MWIRVELTNLAANSNSKKGRREEKEAGFLQEVKRNILVWRNITDKSEGCTSESLPLSPMVKQDEIRTRLERSSNQQISRSQWKLAHPIGCILCALLLSWTTEALFWWSILHRPGHRPRLRLRLNSNFPGFSPVSVPRVPQAHPCLCCQGSGCSQWGVSPDFWEHGCPNLGSSELGLSKRSPGNKD